MALHEKCQECLFYTLGGCNGTKQDIVDVKLRKTCIIAIQKSMKNVIHVMITKGVEPALITTFETLTDALIEKIDDSAIKENNIPTYYVSYSALIAKIVEVKNNDDLTSLVSEIRTSLAKACGEE